MTNQPNALEQLFNFSYLSKAASFSIPDIVAALTISFALGLFIFFVHTKTFKGVMHSSSFGIALIAMNLITTLVILAVSTNLIISLGMVGAGLIPMAVIGSGAIGLILFIFANRKVNDTPYIVVISCDREEAEIKSLRLIEDATKKNVIKAKSASKSGVELTVEVRLKNSSSQFVNALLNIEGVSNATLVSYNGDYYM